MSPFVLLNSNLTLIDHLSNYNLQSIPPIPFLTIPTPFPYRPYFLSYINLTSNQTNPSGCVPVMTCFENVRGIKRTYYEKLSASPQQG